MRILPRRFSLRTLALGVASIASYFGFWEMTKSMGVRSSDTLLQAYEAEHGAALPAALTPPNEESPGPFLIRRTEYGYMYGTDHYYLWLFGPRFELRRQDSG